MGSSDTKPKVAYIYEVDEYNRPIPGSKKSARQKPALSHRRSEDKRKSKSEPGADGMPILMTGALQEEARTEKVVKLERRKSSAGHKSPHKEKPRPSTSHGHRPPVKVSIPQENPSQYGIPAGTPSSRALPPLSQPVPIPFRPLYTSTQTYPMPSRPQSYHAGYSSGYGPPLSTSAFFNQTPVMAGPYTPQSPSYAVNYPLPSPALSHAPVAPPRTLHERFGATDPISRTSSAYGPRDAPLHHQIEAAYDDGYASASEAPFTRRRRNSIRQPTGRTATRAELDYDYEDVLEPRRRIRTQEDEDYDRKIMPPPTMRPSILRNGSSRTYDYHTDSVPDPPPQAYREDSVPRRPSNRRNSVSYDSFYDQGGESERARIETHQTANTSQRRRSYIGEPSPATSNPSPVYTYERQAHEAQNYQEGVRGPTVPLTAEALRREQRRQAGSSRSTKSSGSRDESDYRKSATTRTSTGPDDENVTIKVTGQARVINGNTHIEFVEGGQVEIQQQPRLRNGSEASEYGDTRSRRPSGRSRKSSQSGQSYTRSSSRHPVQHWP